MNNQLLNLNPEGSQQYWESAWNKAKQQSLFKKTTRDPVTFWNKRAANFSKNTTGGRGEQRVQKIINWLEQEGVKLAGSTVLDIGAGPGSFAVPLAKQAQEVVAIEPSDQMVALMEQYASDNQLTNIKVITDKWDEDFHLEHHGLKNKKFDLVFSSMNPGISDWNTLKKALDCSEKYCYISTFAGKRHNPALEELWQLVYNEPMPPWPGDIFYIANVLYSRGYEFSFKVWEETNLEQLSTQEAVDTLTEMLLRYATKSGEDVEKQVMSYVKEREKQDVFSQQITTRLGKILVRL